MACGLWPVEEVVGGNYDKMNKKEDFSPFSSFLCGGGSFVVVAFVCLEFVL